jgi:Zn-dependent oligopeptidase
MRKELEAVTEFKRNYTGNDTAELGPFDVSYYLELMDKENDQFLDEAELSEYFPLEHVVNTTLDIYQELLSLKFKKVECQAWLEEISCYRAYDEESE